MSVNYPAWAIKNKMGYSCVLGDPEGHVIIILKDGRNLTQPITEEEAKNILAGESDGFGKWLMSENLLGKQVKAFSHIGVIVGSYPAGLYHPEELFIVSMFGELNNQEYFTRSQFEILQ